ncbi:MarR family transcriptional regulator [Sphingopyxis sp. MWB1]|uniref:MarR family transcriptional regulator n=1 Tax=Sphingopyxis sp. MWB1 TaxID=1537715 RepID=UPI00136300B8|nr:MarR family transcriptional regulator [Sphingopyxis sp. MWB1]
MEKLPGARLAAALPPAQAVDHMRAMVRLDIIWLRTDDKVEEGLLSAIADFADAGTCGLVCETSLAGLDRMMAMLPADRPVQWLVDPTAAERLAALVSAQPDRRLVLHDIARDTAMERIDRLQEEVARISRFLGQLTARESGLPGYDGLGADRARPDPLAQVQAPGRSFRGMPGALTADDGNFERQRAKQVRRLLRQRRMREQYFPADMFADPAWDMLLDLYAARLEKQPVSVSSLCIAAAVPATTALRWIKTMTDAGLFLREADPHDGRRIFIALAQGAFDSMGRYFDALEE